jgi:hypothetical protein
LKVNRPHNTYMIQAEIYDFTDLAFIDCPRNRHRQRRTEAGSPDSSHCPLSGSGHVLPPDFAGCVTLQPVKLKIDCR